MIYDIQKAFTEGNLSAQEQWELLEQVTEGLRHVKSQLMEDCRYCRGCEKHYFKNELKLISREGIKTVCTNPLTGGYLDPYEYEEQKVREFCYMCPEGHEVTKWKEWLTDL